MNRSDTSRRYVEPRQGRSVVIGGMSGVINKISPGTAPSRVALMELAPNTGTAVARLPAC